MRPSCGRLRPRTHLVRGHEHLGELGVVLEVDSPDGEALAVKLLVEPGEGLLAGVEVGVLPLPLLEVEGRLGQVVEGVLDLGLGGDKGLLLLLVGLLLLGGLLLLLGGGSGGLGLLSRSGLGRGLVRPLLGELGVAVVEDRLELLLVHKAAAVS